MFNFRGTELRFFLYPFAVGVLDVLKGMQEVGVSVDIETLSKYIIPTFPSAEAARQALQVTRKSARVYPRSFEKRELSLIKVFPFRMRASPWIRGPSWAQRFACWLCTTWPNCTPHVSASTSTLHSILSTHHHRNRCFACGLIGPALTHTHTFVHLPLCAHQAF